MAGLIRNASFLKRALLSPQGFRRGILGTSSSQICNFSSKGKKKSKSNGSESGEDNMSKKEVALQQALDQITSSFGKGSIMWLGRGVTSRHVPVVSTGSFVLDIALGTGGLPKGRVVEIYGPEASGKTTLGLHVIAEAQKQGGYCVFVDAEHALDPSLAQAIGVKTENLLLSQPDCGEQALSLVDTLIRSGSVDVVVVDSVAALVPKGELDGEMGDAHMAMQARLMSQALRKLSHSLSLSQTILIFINQVRAKISTFGGFAGPTEVTCGGNALKFYASVRINVKRIGLIKKGEETVGSQVVAKIVKNKLAPPFKTVQFELEFGKGINRESEIIDASLHHKFITRAGGFYSFNEQTFRGKDALKQYMAENESLKEELMTKLKEKILGANKEEPEAGAIDEDVSEETVSTDKIDEKRIEAKKMAGDDENYPGSVKQQVSKPFEESLEAIAPAIPAPPESDVAAFVVPLVLACCPNSWIAKTIKKMLVEGIETWAPRLEIEKAVVDFPSPNIAKELHVGHLRTCIIGDAIARLLEFSNVEVLCRNHVGDWGTQFGMLLELLFEENPNWDVEGQLALHDLAAFFKKANARFKEDSDFKERAQKSVVRLQGGEVKSVKAWEKIKEISRRAYNELFRCLGVQSEEMGRSFYGPYIPEVLEALSDQVKDDDGTRVIFSEILLGKGGKSLCLIVVKSDGGYSYDTTDLAALWYRVNQEKADWIIYVTDVGQKGHFQMVFEAAERAGCCCW
ncbi:hypothetical protein LWI29_010008 [Acer saccharum]|uniref:Arginyl-tRNA synthetase n=1 Tax=Acer saccharum TaxID=4024 RepID=A0AA39RDB1_ACESA|nr:hypothetical protein LWI29_010008 [Acer saccharum]